MVSFLILIGIMIGMGACLLGLIYTTMIMFRNTKVRHMLLGMLEMIRVAAEDDIKNGRNPDWRINEIKKVQYEEIVFKVWRPVKPSAFWKNTDFLHPVKKDYEPLPTQK